MVLPPSKRQKAQKPHGCAVFLLLKCLLSLKCKMLFCDDKITVYLPNFLRAVQPAFSTVSSEGVVPSLFYAMTLERPCIPCPFLL